MSQADFQDFEKGNAKARIQRPQDETKYGDSSGPLFAIYSKSAEKSDNMVAERWIKDAEGINIFDGLFSAVIAAFVVVSLQDLRPSSQDTATFYLERMYGLPAQYHDAPFGRTPATSTRVNDLIFPAYSTSHGGPE